MSLLALLLAAPVLAASDHSSGDGAKADNERLLPGVLPSSPVYANSDGLREPYDPFFDVDWSVALRGSYVNTTDTERTDIRLVPTLSLDHTGSRSAIGLDADAELIRPVEPEGEVDVTALRLNLEGGYALDRDTALTGAVRYSLTQAVAGTPDLSNGIAVGPETRSLQGSVGATRQFGKFALSGTGDIERLTYGPTLYENGDLIDNSDDDLWSLDGSLRLGFQATPIFEVFTQAGLGRDMFDQPSSVLAITRDATEKTLRVGLAGEWNELLSASVATGWGWRTFDDPALDDVSTRLYDASVVFTPDPTWRFAANLQTDIEPSGPDNAGTAQVQHTVSGTIDYTVNSWLRLNALGGWRTAQFTDSAETETGYDLGLGADYTLNAHTGLGADYGFSHTNSTRDGIEDSHRVTVGVTVSR